jgi:anaerobic selenocysteine-containing dehydrogenase
MQQILDLIDAMEAGAVDVLLIHDSNPVFALPDASRFRQALDKVPLVVAMSTFHDETTDLADIILPTSSYLESWGDDIPDPGVGMPVASISQPVVATLYDTLSAGDIVLALARQIGGELPMQMSWGSTEEFVKARWRKEYEMEETEPDDSDFDEFWRASLEAGVWGRPGMPDQTMPSGAATMKAISNPVSEFAGNEADYPLVLYPYLSATFLDGRGANSPWLQETPDPLTSVVYGSWAELNPLTAEDLGINEGDVLQVETPAGSVKVPALIFPAIRPGVVAMPIGQGHTSYGRYAAGRGMNPMRLVQMQIDDKSGDLAWAATRAKVSNTGERMRIVKTDGVSRTLGRQILGPADNHG